MLRSVRVDRAVRQGRQLAVAQPRGAVVALLLPLAVLGWAVARPAVPASRALSAMRVWALGPVYTVADVERQMAQGNWIGRTVLVQGRAALYRTWSPPDSTVTRLPSSSLGKQTAHCPSFCGGAAPTRGRRPCAGCLSWGILRDPSQREQAGTDQLGIRRGTWTLMIPVIRP